MNKQRQTSNGMKRVLVVGGSKEYTGALYLCGISALRSGAGSVIVMAPSKVAWALNSLSPDLMTRKLNGEYLTRRHLPAIKKQLATAEILLIGNGAGTRPRTASLMRSLMRWPGLKIVDADALKVLKGNDISNAILTPNEGEWKLLERNNDMKKMLKRNVVIIKKGVHTKILANEKTFNLRKSNPGLERAGMGDILAGLCAGGLARGLSLSAAARSAAKISSDIAGLFTRRKKGYFFLASDIAAELKKYKSI
ncbi:MAG TPA: NAD(P)H-hydrate dehydratase [Candidatus Paceibacterota bacterium]